MKKLSLITIILACLPVFSQAIYQQSNYATVGTSYTYSTAVATSVDPAVISGANVTWDYSTLAVQNQRATTVLDPNAAGYRFSYIGTCVAFGGNILTCSNNWNNWAELAIPNPLAINVGTFQLQNVIDHSTTSSNALINTIFGANFNNFPIAIGYTLPDTVYQFPLQYNNAETSNSLLTFDLTPAGQNIIYKIVRKRDYRVDSWGTLITPYGTFDSTLRVATTITRNDTLIQGGNSIPIPSFTEVIYNWINPSYGLPLLTINGNGALGNVTYTGLSYIDSARCIQPTAGFIAIPPTANVGAAIGCNNTSTNSQSYRWDFGDGSTSADANPSHTYANAGTYPIQLITCNINCPTPTCDTTTRTVTINPAPSSTINEIAVSNFTIVPNPTSDYFQLITNKENIKITKIELVDMTGKKIILPYNPSERVNISSVANGIYSLLIHTSTAVFSQKLVIQK